MLVATCVIVLRLDGVYSLKDKRSIVKSLTTRLGRQFNLSVAEIDYQDAWHQAAIGLAAVGNDAGHLHGLLEKAVAWVASTRPDVPIDDYTIEFR